MKRTFTFIFAIIMIISVLTACGGRDKNTTTTPAPVATVNPTNNAMDSSGNVSSNGSDDGMLDKAGDAIHDAGNAVENAVDSVMDPNTTPSPELTRNRMK